MQSFQYSFKTPKKVAEFLRERFPYHEYDKWAEIVADGKILINGYPVSPNATLKKKDIITYIRFPEDEPCIDTEFSILFEDESMVAVEKNGNIPVSQSGRYFHNTLIRLVEREKKYPKLYAVQRLDKETSGVLVFARSAKIASALGEIISSGSHDKIYYAVLRGEMTDPVIDVEAPLGKTITSEIRIKQQVRPDGRPSRTVFKRVLAMNGLTLAEIIPYNGRTHQIRCHADHIGFPIAGDKLYGTSDDEFLELNSGDKIFDTPATGPLPRQLLHAGRLEIPHPVTEKSLVFESDWRPFFAKFATIKANLLDNLT